jgi:dTDP-4-dehydrorhamnose reductase
MAKPRLLITGASGFLGWSLCRAGLAAWDVWGVCRSHPVRFDGVTMARADLTDASALRDLFAAVTPAAVIHAASTSRIDACERQPRETRAINVEASRAIAGLCADRDIPCVFTSTDLVFDGTRAPYAEDDAPRPICAYGEQKAAAEQVMRARYERVAVCRLPLMFGYTQGANQTFLYDMVGALRAGSPIRLFVDEWRTPVDAASAAAGVFLALDRAPGETLHLGGRERLSRWELGHTLARCMGADPSNIGDVPTLARRPPDVSLASAKAYARGYDPAAVETALRTALAQWGVVS